jgi:ferrous iron transport protein B
LNKLQVVLAGNPNCGKSSLFNALTGLKQKTSNVPGTTVEIRKGVFPLEDGREVHITDLPGSYSFHPGSDDEKVAADYLSNSSTDDLVIFIADASQLKRNLLFFSQIADAGRFMILAVNMIDVAETRGIETDITRLENELGIPVVAINARIGTGVEAIRKKIGENLFKVHYKFLQHSPGNKEDETVDRFTAIQVLMDKVQRRKPPLRILTVKIDGIVLHRYWGILIFLLVMFLVFQSVFFLAKWPMDLIEMLFSGLSQWAGSALPPNFLTGLIIGGLIPGLSGVLVFLPQIAILFFFITLLEDSGYMARITYLMDWPMRKFGLSGKSVLPLMSGAACAIPAILSARSIENKKEKLLTILVTPLMSCSARLPVYTILAALVVPDNASWGFFNLKGLLLMGMYLLGFVTSLLAALVISFFIKQRSKSTFVIELPVYRTPHLANLWHVCFNKSKSFVTGAGKIILIVSVVLWFLASHGYGNKWDKLNNTVVTDTAQHNAEILKASFAGEIGKFIEPAIEPLGFNWKIGIALVTSFAAREVFVGTMATIYGLENKDDYRSIKDKMASDTNPITGKPVYSVAVAFSLMIFYAFAMQCISTLAVVYKETGSIKLPLLQLTFMTALAWLSSWLVYVVLS